jgi:uncharacterized membrane protein
MAILSWLRTALKYMQQLMHTLDISYGSISVSALVRLSVSFNSFLIQLVLLNSSLALYDQTVIQTQSYWPKLNISFSSLFIQSLILGTAIYMVQVLLTRELRHCGIV